MDIQVAEGTKIAQVNNLLTEIQRWPHWEEIQLGAQKEYRLSTDEFYHILPEYQKFIMPLLKPHPVSSKSIKQYLD